MGQQDASAGVALGAAHRYHHISMRMGMGEILVILVVVLLIFGANKIPQLGDALGRGIRNFKKAKDEDDAIDITPRPQQQDRLREGASSSVPGVGAEDAAADKKV
jgi:sec-independent protein translocase protein TatA